MNKNFPKIALFGCSWTDAYYNDHTDVRHKTWSEYFYDYNPNVQIYNYGFSGASLDFCMARLSSLLSHETIKDDFDAIIFEIPPLHRNWVPISSVGWIGTHGLFNELSFEEQRREPFHDPVPENYWSQSVYKNSCYFVAGDKTLPNIGVLDEPWEIYNDKKNLENYFKFKAAAASDHDVFKNITMLSSLEHIQNELDIPIYTLSFADVSLFHGWENEYTDCALQTLSGNFWPSNIGITSVLEEFRKEFPNIKDKEWWADDSHPSGKGNKWICDNILMKNDTIRRIVMGDQI